MLLPSEEHELELQDLRAENQRLNEELSKLRGEATRATYHAQPAGAGLRTAASKPEPDPPHVPNLDNVIRWHRQNMAKPHNLIQSTTSRYFKYL